MLLKSCASNLKLGGDLMSRRGKLTDDRLKIVNVKNTWNNMEICKSDIGFTNPNTYKMKIGKKEDLEVSSEISMPRKLLHY